MEKIVEKTPSGTGGWPLSAVVAAPGDGHAALVLIDGFLIRLRASAPHDPAKQTAKRLRAMAEACSWAAERFADFTPPKVLQTPETVSMAAAVFGPVSLFVEEQS